MKYGQLSSALLLVGGLLQAGTIQDGEALDGAHGLVARLQAAQSDALRTILEGRVLTPEGHPAQGAVAVSSAGGKAVSDAAGRFTLEVELPQGAEEVQVTAVRAGGGNGLVASAAVRLLHPRGTNPVGTLKLQHGASCEPSWLPTFGCQPGVSPSFVSALTVYDDGSGGGPALYAAGDFTIAGGQAANRVAKWDGTSWSPIGSGTNDQVRALTAHDDGSGSGPALYAGGWFTTAGGVAANNIAKWDGTSWSPLGSGMNEFVGALTVYDDGSGGGPDLHASGPFTVAGGVTAYCIASWDGASWSPLGTGIDEPVYALTVHDDGLGGGPALFAAGTFTTADGVELDHIARWDGSSWSPLGSGLDSAVEALAVYDDGSGGGPALSVGGYFTEAGGVPAGRIAKWDGSTWSPLGAGMNSGAVSALTVYDDGSGGGPAPYAGGLFTFVGGLPANRVARWDGSSWSPLGSGLNERVWELAVYDDGPGSVPALYAGGSFTTAGGAAANGIAKWDGSSWSPLGAGMTTWVGALIAHDDGTGAGPALYAGGDFQTSPAGDSYIAKWGGCAPGVGSPYCLGDGSGTVCPCGNSGAPGAGCANSIGSGALLAAGGTNSVSADDLVFHATNLVPNQPALVFAGHNAVNNGDGLIFGDGLRCAGGSVERLGVMVPNANGAADRGPGLAATGSWMAGDTRRFQVWYRDPTGSLCGSGFNLANGYEIAFRL